MVVATVPVTDIEKAKDFYAGSGTSPGPVAPSGQFWSPRAGRLTVRRWLMSSGNGTASC